jgi:hypothetical protein
MGIGKAKKCGDTVLPHSELTLAELGITKRESAEAQAYHALPKAAKEAEDGLGRALAATDRAKGTDKGGRTKLDGDRALPSNPPPTLAELGITKGEGTATASGQGSWERKVNRLW